jgi:hypothetical protein
MSDSFESVLKDVIVYTLSLPRSFLGSLLLYPRRNLDSSVSSQTDRPGTEGTVPLKGKTTTLSSNHRRQIQIVHGPENLPKSIGTIFFYSGRISGYIGWHFPARVAATEFF